MSNSVDLSPSSMPSMRPLADAMEPRTTADSLPNPYGQED